MTFVDAFCGKLEEIHCNYRRGTDDDGQEMLCLGVSGDHFSGLQFGVLFDNKASAQIHCHICKFPAEKNLLALQTVNQLNLKYRWTKFCVKSSGEVRVTMDVQATEDTAADVFIHSLYMMNAIIDQTYPVLMKAVYS